ncbi:VQ protein [Dillenia turbinata]|uniref:VQ protein n=1 Tax=Dillenia turbinata TaxID=194707 RepID=A0AAN8YYS4_9MAGN
MAAKTCKGDPVKVVIISTRYVQTDPKNFKSVVQSLTGKNSSVQDQVVSPNPERSKTTTKSFNGYNGGYNNDKEMAAVSETGCFEEQLDNLLLEMPPAEELRSLLDE